MGRGGRGQRRRCRECGAAYPPSANVCPLCGSPVTLTASVAKVEETVAARGRAGGRRVVEPRRFALPTIALAALLSLTGLWLLPVRILLGSFTLLAGIALLAIGALLRFARVSGQ